MIGLRKARLINKCPHILTWMEGGFQTREFDPRVEIPSKIRCSARKYENPSSRPSIGNTNLFKLVLYNSPHHKKTVFGQFWGHVWEVWGVFGKRWTHLGEEFGAVWWCFRQCVWKFWGCKQPCYKPIKNNSKRSFRGGAGCSLQSVIFILSSFFLTPFIPQTEKSPVFLP